MAQKTIDTTTNHGSYVGDTATTAFSKVNANFDELYAGNFPGNVIAAAAVLANINFISSSADIVIGTKSGASGSVKLRPNGYDSSSNEVTLSSNGYLNLYRNIVSEDQYAVLANSGATGSVNLRPNGAASSTGELVVTSSGAVTCTSLTQTSSAEVKDVSGMLDDALSIINKIGVVLYQYKPTFSSDTRQRVGVIAEQIADSFPQAYLEPSSTLGDDSSDGDGVSYPSVDYQQIGVLAARGVQQLVEQLASLTARVEALEPKATT